jgi:hypothetical protein
MNEENKKYKSEDVLRVMQIIRCNGNLMYLETEDFKLSKIVEIFDYLKQKQYICRDAEGGLQVTEGGKRLFEQLCRQYGLRGLYKYMIPNTERRVSQKKITEIYIPTK